MHEPSLNPFSALALANPYPVYRRLREQSPVHALATGRWVVTRHHDANALLNDPRCAHWGQAPPAGQARPAQEQALADVMQLFAPSLAPDSARRSITAALNASALEDIDVRLGRMADQALDAQPKGQTFDALAAYAHPITMLAVGEMLALSAAQTLALGDAIAAQHGSFFDALRVPGHNPPQDGAAATLPACLEALIDDADPSSSTSVIARLATALPDAASRRDRLFNALLVLIYASHHNMMNFIGNGLLALATQPVALAQLRREPALMQRAVLELLRHDSPLQYIVLTARHPIDMHGQTLRPGDDIMVCIGSANRDPVVFDDPDALNFQRTNHHALLSFGTGAWRCIGARLAVRIGCAAFSRIVPREFAVNTHLGPLRWTHSPMVQRGLAALPLLLT